jgi:hypothetical protein
MKKTFTMMASVSLLAAAFCACDKDEKKDDSSTLTQITITNVTAKEGYPLSSVDSVRLTIGYGEGSEYKTVVLARAAFTDGKAVINLPASVDDKYLEAITGVSAGITVSNPSVKTVNAHLTTNFGSFNHGTIEQEWYGGLMYMNGNVAITGTGTDKDGGGTPYTIKFSIDGKKGWNMVYWSDDVDPVEYTTNPPAGAGWIHGS